MNPLMLANTAMTAIDVLNIIGKKNPKFKKSIDQALSQGSTPEEVISYLRGDNLPNAAQVSTPKGYTEAERSDRMRAGNKLSSVLGFLKGSLPGILALGAGAYGLHKGVQALQGIGSSSSPTPPPPSSNPSPMGINAMGVSAGSPQASPMGVNAMNSSNPKVTMPTGPNFSAIAKQVMNTFGYKNKPLVKLVSEIIEKTGEEVEDVYNKLKVNDISTAEKASSAAKNMLENLTKDLLPQGRGIEKSVRKAEDIKKDIAKDLASSVIHKTNYDPEKQELFVNFNSGNTYKYDQVPENVYQEFTKAGTPAKTEGKNAYGIWWEGKNPSLGATFNKLIKEGGYAYERIEDGTPPSPTPQKGREFVSSLKKAEKAVLDKPAAKKGLTADQAIARIDTYKKQLSSLKGENVEERKKKILSYIDERQKDLDRIQKLKKNKKTKVFTDELIKYENSQGKNLVKKLIPLLPYAIANSVKKKFESTDESILLQFILKSLK